MNSDKFTYLIYKKYIDGLNQEESLLLNEWLQASDEHIEIEKSIKLSMTELDDYEPTLEINAAEDFKALKAKMSTPKKDASIKSMSRNYWKWIGSAAAVAILTFASFLMFDNNENEQLITYKTNAGETQLVTLADGSKVWLNEKSSIGYLKGFNNNRKISLTGEALFEVAKQNNKTFEIETANSIVAVLGTSFNVRAYNTESYTQLAVKTGKVSFKSKMSPEKAILVANQAATLNHEIKKITPLAFENLNPFVWQDQLMSFKSMALKEVIISLENQFDVNIDIKNEAIKDCLVTMSAQKADLQKILNNIKILIGVDIEQEKNGSYTIKGGKCW